MLTSPALDPTQAAAPARKVHGLLGEQVQHAEHGTLTALTEPLLADVRLGTGRHRTVAFLRPRAGEQGTPAERAVSVGAPGAQQQGAGGHGGELG